MEMRYHHVVIKRAYEPLDRYMKANRVLVIFGPRRVGKTTLLDSYLASTQLKYRLAVGDHLPTQQVLSSLNVDVIKEYLQGFELFALDEAQYISNIGRALKIVVDQIPGIQVIATGSSSFELAGQVGEPLTGRKRTLTLFPIAQSEFLSLLNRFDLREKLDDFLIYGTYPEAITEETRAAKIEVVNEIAGSYLLKDILAFERVRSADKLWDLLKMLAFQIGGEVSHNELANALGLDVKTIQRYLDLLEKSFVVFRLRGFSRNLRNEVTQKAKYYFYDTGIRNAVISQFNRLDQRNDVGQLWENFMVAERMKQLEYTPEYANFYFWRTYDQQEIDLVEERGEELRALEFKWAPRRTQSAPKAWRTTYPGGSYSVITPENYQDLLLPQ
jgi:hypothetical protein